MGNSKTLILVHTAMEDVSLEADVNLMLTPQFYTFKKESLPVQYVYQAKRIAPSLFEGLLEEGKEYEYVVWKEGDDWVFLAYDLVFITSFLEEKGFALEHVSKLFFAQQSTAHFVEPLSLGEHEALLSLDNVIVVVPKVALSDECSLVFDDSFSPKKGIMFHSAYGAILTLKQSIILATIFGFLAMIFFVEGSRYAENSKVIEMKMEELLEAYPALSSKYTRDSVISKYKTLDRVERKKREIIKTLASMIFKGVKLKSFKMNEKKFSAHFSCKDAEVFKRVKALANKHNFKTLNVSSGHELKIEGIL